jgi:hypothetical protein
MDIIGIIGATLFTWQVVDINNRLEEIEKDEKSRQAACELAHPNATQAFIEKCMEEMK